MIARVILQAIALGHVLAAFELLDGRHPPPPGRAQGEEAQAGPACGGELVVQGPGYLASTGFPEDYPPMQRCEWLLRAAGPGQRLALAFNPHFDIEKHDCRFDYVEVRDGEGDAAEAMGRFCGSVAPAPIVSSGPTLLIRFVSDYTNQGAGFSLRYEIHKSGSDACSRNLSGPAGVVSSPGFPDKYPPFLACTYVIRAARGGVELSLRFTHFHLEGATRAPGAVEPALACQYDRLEVWDGLPHVGLLVGRFCGTRSPGLVRSSTGILSLSFYTDAEVARDGFSASYTTSRRNVTRQGRHGEEACMRPLGMESGEILDEQISASPGFYGERWRAEQTRLHHAGAACFHAPTESAREWLQVDLRFVRLLGAVATQGALASNSTGAPCFVTAFRLEYSTSGSDWTVYRDVEKNKVIQGNRDDGGVALHRFAEAVVARYVRVKPVRWRGGLGLRLELYGCHISDAPCSEMLGLVSGEIGDRQLSASSSRDVRWGAPAARLLSARSGWVPANVQAGGQWLQVDLGTTRQVSGLLLQGAKIGPTKRRRPPLRLPLETERKVFVRSFRLQLSLDGESWVGVQDPAGADKIFPGNSNADKPELRRINATLARFLRLLPEKWSTNGIGVRLEVLGCDAPGTTSSAMETDDTEGDDDEEQGRTITVTGQRLGPGSGDGSWRDTAAARSPPPWSLSHVATTPRAPAGRGATGDSDAGDPGSRGGKNAGSSGGGPAGFDRAAGPTGSESNSPDPTAQDGADVLENGENNSDSQGKEKDSEQALRSLDWFLIPVIALSGTGVALGAIFATALLCRSRRNCCPFCCGGGCCCGRARGHPAQTGAASSNGRASGRCRPNQYVVHKSSVVSRTASSASSSIV
ncbi:neuropilin-2-like isoform X1 [Lethenteron reissneri]|uniref:neuropilin-2-like isoform X1 n=2 Tax=Lethenteron reissneri TaxID=7753 RepID=UPI002AB78996|nr:neuropilin-2-like isoform X1 [Lethenteron reissneri]